MSDSQQAPADDCLSSRLQSLLGLGLAHRDISWALGSPPTFQQLQEVAGNESRRARDQDGFPDLSVELRFSFFISKVIQNKEDETRLSLPVGQGPLALTLQTRLCLPTATSTTPVALNLAAEPASLLQLWWMTNDWTGVRVRTHVHVHITQMGEMRQTETGGKTGGRIRDTDTKAH